MADNSVHMLYCCMMGNAKRDNSRWRQTMAAQNGNLRWFLSPRLEAFASRYPKDGIQDDANVIRSGLDSLGLVSLTSEALLSAMTWLAVHKMRSQII